MTISACGLQHDEISEKALARLQKPYEHFACMVQRDRRLLFGFVLLTFATYSTTVPQKTGAVTRALTP